MKNSAIRSARSDGALRRGAEEKLHAQPLLRLKGQTQADTQRLVHELQVHQIELEMQNAELQRARVETEAAVAKYTDLYDFAPVGYFSVDQEGLIQEANLTAATMLESDRTRLITRRLNAFVAPTSRPVVTRFLETVFSKRGKQTCEALLATAANRAFWADLNAVSAAPIQGKARWCRLAVSDISALKRGEEAQRAVQSLADAVAEANKEIARRRAAESSLRQSEQMQHSLLLESQGLHAQLRRLTHLLLQAQEEERKQISRELHDEVGQILTGINIQLAACTQTSTFSPSDLGRRLSQTKRLVGTAIETVHDFARRLRPTMIDDLGLVPALRSLVKELTKQGNLRIRFVAAFEVDSLDSRSRSVLFRVAQEAITNVIRHAHARNATVRVSDLPGVVRLEVIDDGRSFSTQRVLAAKNGGRLGLLGMRERVEMAGGRLNIESTPGKGTKISAEVPTRSAVSR